MRIGMVLDHIFPPDIRVENEALSLIQNGNKLFLLCLSQDKHFPSSEVYCNIEIRRVSKSEQWIRKGRALVNTIFDYYTLFWAKQIIKFAVINRIEVLHIHDLSMLGASIVANEKLRLPIVADLHENYVDGLKYYRFSNSFPGKLIISIPKWRKKEIEWCSKADYIITVIDEAKERYHTLGIPYDKITIVANYVNQDNFLAQKDNAEIMDKFKNHFIISYYGGFDIHRGLESLILAMPEIVKKCENIKLVLVGKGKNYNKLVQLSKSLNVEKSVSFEGFQPQSYLPSYIKISNVCLIPHLKTNHTDNTIPHKLFHYMALGKPVVAANCNPIQRIVHETQCGLIYTAGNQKELAEKIIQLYENPELRKRMGDNGRKAVFKKYNWKNTSKNLIKLYEEILRVINES